LSSFLVFSQYNKQSLSLRYLKYKIIPMVQRLSFLITFFPLFAFGQISGTVSDAQNNPIPFATIFIKELRSGTVANEDGAFLLNLPEGNYTVTFQALGYLTEEKNLTIPSSIDSLLVVLKPNLFFLPEVVVNKSDFEKGEMIAKKAIALAPFHRQKITTYTAQSYIKGSARIKDVPFLLRKSLKDSGLDSTTSFVLESTSKILYESPDKFTETVQTFRSLGTDNPAVAPFFYPDFTRENSGSTFSPLAENALNHYTFRLDNTFYDQNILVYKLNVIPNRNAEGLFKGDIYILDNIWSLYATDLTTTTNGFQISINQTFAPMDPKNWMPVSNKINLSGNVTGVRFEYLYVTTLKDYDIKYQEEAFFKKYGFVDTLYADPFYNPEKKEVKNIRNLSGENKSRFESVIIDSFAVSVPEKTWDSIRPVPLTNYEVKGIQLIDSLVINNPEVFNNSPSYPTQRSKNPVIQNFLSLIYGNSYPITEKTSIIWDPLFSKVNFNPVEGYYLFNNLRLKSENVVELKFTPRYGFSDQKFRFLGEANFGKNSLVLSGGRYIFQYGDIEQITPFLNTYQNLVFENNFIRLYQKTFLKIKSEIPAAPKLTLTISAEYALRNHLDITTQQTWINSKNKTYAENIPENPNFNLEFDRENKALLGTLELLWKPAPRSTVKFSYLKGFNPSSEDAFSEFNLVKALYRQSIRFPARGRLTFEAEAGKFFNSGNIAFQDMIHFSGNSTNFFSKSPVGNFRTLGFYTKSTDGHFLRLSGEYQFKKFALTQFPSIWQAGIKESLFINHAETGAFSPYTEIGYSVSNIFRIFRVEIVTGIDAGQSFRPKWMLGLSTRLFSAL
jgi:hypothetical protein